MREMWAVSMLISGGLFAGGVLSVAWERLPAWLKSDLTEFLPSFAYTARRVDVIQPVLLVVCLISTIGFAISADGAARTLALAAAGGLFMVLVGSVGWLVPLQRRLIENAVDVPSSKIDSMRTQWFRGHVLRTGVAVASLILSVVAAVF